MLGILQLRLVLAPAVASCGPFATSVYAALFIWNTSRALMTASIDLNWGATVFLLDGCRDRIFLSASAFSFISIELVLYVFMNIYAFLYDNEQYQDLQKNYTRLLFPKEFV
jgi:hypothetical protein